ncbi:helix-turn-helix domain-containing protein [Glycomyces sp. NPDC048151]|uniref:helix-turn-helix domain-containing protein n=1 Tax=Glycomyces sp. NPDC048151 TaxID=3364002 RepID=UPI00371BF72F
MTESQPTIARRSLGRALERHRESHNLSRAQAGRAIGYSGQTIQRIEEGTQATRTIVVEKLCARYGISPGEMSHLTTLASRSKERGWWEPYFDIGAEETSRPKIPLFLETEQSALRISVLETEVIPGLLQTPEYLRVLQAAQLPMSDEVAENWRGLRTKRQELLYGRDPFPVLEFVIGRAAIDYLDAMPAAVRDGQIARLLEVAAIPNVQIRVLTQLHAASAGSFNIPYPGDATDPFVFMDAQDGCRYIEERRIVSMFEQTFGSAREKTVQVEEYLR